MVKIINNKDAINAIDHVQKINLPCLLLGETGTGKTTLVRHLADKSKNKLTRINLNGQTGREELLGKYVLIGGETIRQDGPLTTALKEGHWILLDEINAALPEVLFTIQALTESVDGKLGDLLLAEHDGTIIVPHKKCRIFATANPAGRYVGTKSFNAATLSRFVVINIDPLSDIDELAVLESRYPKLKKNVYAKIIQIMSKLREKEKDGEYKYEYFCSTRDLVNTAALIDSGLDIKHAVYIGILNKVQSEFEKKKIKSVIDKVLDISEKKSEAELTTFVSAKKELDKIKSDYELGESKIKELTKTNESLIEDIDKLKNINEKLKNSIKKTESIIKTFTKAATLFDTIDDELTKSTTEDTKNLEG